jgi:hypothetical protein
VLLVTALLLGFCWYALVASYRTGEAESELNQLLIECLVDGERQLAGDAATRQDLAAATQRKRLAP